MGASRKSTTARPTVLDAERIAKQLARDHQKRPALRIEQEVDSTNTQLARLRAAGETVEVLLAESQSAGRGRRGRHWISPPGAGVYLSMFRAFAGPVRRLEALGLVAGLAGAVAIERCCGVRAGLKWPNDVQIDGRKVAGCLIDLGGVPGAAQAIIGIGINVDFGGWTGPDQPWTDLASATGQAPDRHRLAATLIDQLTDDLNRFDAHGFGELQAQWAIRDVLSGREVVACGPRNTSVQGRVLGVDESGRLLLQTPDELQRLHGGEVTLNISR